MKRIFTILLILLSTFLPKAGLFTTVSLLWDIVPCQYEHSFLHDPSSLFAQTGPVSIGLGFGLDQSTILDEYISPMQYKGEGFLFKAGIDKVNERHYNQLEFIYQKNKIEPDIDNSSLADFYRWTFDILRAWKIGLDDRNLSIYFGGHFLSTFGGVNHEDWFNNSYSYSLSVNVGPSLVATIIPLPAMDDLELTWALSIPIMDYIVRPSHGSILPDRMVSKGDDNPRSFITEGSFTSLHEYQRIYSNIYLSYKLTKRILIRTGYQWDFQNYTVNNKYQSANHIISIGLYYRIKT